MQPKLYKVGFGGLIDVFFGDGWKTWTRVQVKKTSFGPRIFYKGGFPLNKEKLIQIGKQLDRKE